MSVTIRYDLLCVGCAYNLRTLGFTASCPECGHRNLLSALNAVERIHRLRPGVPPADGPLRGHYPLEAAQIVLCAYSYLIECGRTPTATPVAPGVSPVPPAPLCYALADYAVLAFGQDATATLADHGLQRSDDVGLLIFWLMDQGCIRRRPLQLDEFTEVCDYTTLPAL